VIVVHLATPIMLGSLWALIQAGLAAGIIVCTALEDRTLLEELDGYKRSIPNTCATGCCQTSGKQKRGRGHERKYHTQ